MSVKHLTTQELAARKRDLCAKRVEKWTNTVIYASKKLGEWRTRMAHYDRRSKMTDEQIAELKSKRKPKPKAHRAMDLK